MDNFLTNLPFTTSGALVDTVDSKKGIPNDPITNQKEADNNNNHKIQNVEKILVSLRDGKKLIGVLRSYDQFG
jgi:U6 snRNA-associated Sm-like protein LSm1